MTLLTPQLPPIGSLQPSPTPRLSLQNATISPSNTFIFYYLKEGANKLLQHIGEKFRIHLAPCPRTL